MPPSQPRFEEAGGQRLPLGGANHYQGVRGKQGRGKNQFQGVTPKKQHRTALFDTCSCVSRRKRETKWQQMPCGSCAATVAGALIVLRLSVA